MIQSAFGVVDDNCASRILRAESDKLVKNILGGHSLLTEEEKVDLIENYKKETSLKNKNEIVWRLTYNNYRFILLIMRKHFTLWQDSLTSHDYLMAGFYAYRDVCEEFSKKLGYKVNTYAKWFLRKYLRKTLAESAFCISISTWRFELLNQYRHIEIKLSNELNRPVSGEEVITELRNQRSRNTKGRGFDGNELMRIYRAVKEYSKDNKVGSAFSIWDDVSREAQIEDALKLIHRMREKTKLSFLFYLGFYDKGLLYHQIRKQFNTPGLSIEEMKKIGRILGKGEEELDAMKGKREVVRVLKQELKKTNPRSLYKVGKIFGISEQEIDLFPQPLNSIQTGYLLGISASGVRENIKNNSALLE